MKKKFTSTVVKAFLLLALSYSVSPAAKAQTYCSPTFASGCSGWYNNSIQVGCINWTNSDCSVSDYTAMSTSMIPGTPVAMTVVSGQYTGCAVWIDLNNDGDFDDANENFHTEYQAPGLATYNFNITIPVGTPVGNYRMRVLAGWGSDGTSGQQYPAGNGFGGCGSYAYGNFDDFTVSVVANGNPTFNVQPAPQGVCVGGTATFNSSSTGSTYAWYKAGNAITGATDSAYTINNAQVADAGNYYVVATNCLGSASSDTVALTVNALPNDTIAQASPVTFCQNDTTTLNVPTGNTYSWTMNGTVIAGATNNTYDVIAAGTYAVIVSNNGCIDTSSTVTAVMNAAPVPVVVVSGNILSVSGSYTTYQWYRNGVAISGATTANYTSTQPGHYTVEVTDANGCKGTSAIHTLAVGNVTANSDMMLVEPNPAKDIVNVTINNSLANNAVIWITDVTGKVMNKVTVTATKTTIDVSLLPSGMYFVNYTDDTHKQTVKLVK